MVPGACSGSAAAAPDISEIGTLGPVPGVGVVPLAVIVDGIKGCATEVAALGADSDTEGIPPRFDRIPTSGIRLSGKPAVAVGWLPATTLPAGADPPVARPGRDTSGL